MALPVPTLTVLLAVPVLKTPMPARLLARPDGVPPPALTVMLTPLARVTLSPPWLLTSTPA